MMNALIYMSPDVGKIQYKYISNACQNNMLTLRELECICYLTRSMTCKEIARILNISHRTVEKHIEHAKDKLGCHNRSDLVSKLFELK